MLATIINNIPAPRCIIIEDTARISGKRLLLHILTNHLNYNKYPVHYFFFEKCPEKIKTTCSDKIHIYNCVPGHKSWLGNSKSKDILSILGTSSLTGAIIIDSLTHCIYEYGLRETYGMLHKLLNQTDGNIVQIASIVHEDMLEDNIRVAQYFHYISILEIKLHTESRLHYLFRKHAGRIVNEMEDYSFSGNNLISKSVQKIDPKLLLPSTRSEMLPEEMATFRISLDENEKKSREQLVLPYLKSPSCTGTGAVTYTLDDIDDWDEEDPDDDLDI